jgi:CheY-like chemotaxis protein
METSEITLELRGFINDLTRTLTASMVHLDDLLLELDEDSEEFDHAWLLNRQLGRALEFFLEMRAEYLIWQDCSHKRNIKTRDIYKQISLAEKSLAEKLSHHFNNKLATIIFYYDLLLYEIDESCGLREKIEISIQALEKANTFFNLNCKLNIKSNAIMNKAINKFNYKDELNYETKNKLLEKVAKAKSILLVEDEEELRQLITKALCLRGYTVFEAATGKRALDIFYEKGGNFRLSLIDVELPDMNGPKLGNRLLSQKPDLRIVYMSGYEIKNLRKSLKFPKPLKFLKKPYRLETLLRTVSECLWTC